MKIETITIELTGITNMIMHNGRLADESDPLTVDRKLKQQAYKKSGTKEAWEEFAMSMMRGGVYFDDNRGVYLPEDNLRALLVEAGKKVTKRGTLTYKGAASTINFESDGIGFTILIDGKPQKNLEAFCANKRYRFEKVVKIGKSKVRSVRPLIPKSWTTEVVMEFRPDVIDVSVIVDLFQLAGLEVGIGDWRPSAPKPGPFGQFMVTKVDGKEVA